MIALRSKIVDPEIFCLGTIDEFYRDNFIRGESTLKLNLSREFVSYLLCYAAETVDDSIYGSLHTLHSDIYHVIYTFR